MNVQPSSGFNPIASPGVNGSKPPQPGKVGDQGASFQHSEKLDRSLAATPDVRPGVVDEAKQLVTSTLYPPPRVIRQISTLLAIGLIDQEKI